MKRSVHISKCFSIFWSKVVSVGIESSSALNDSKGVGKAGVSEASVGRQPLCATTWRSAL